jgi:hypothetical protein
MTHDPTLVYVEYRRWAGDSDARDVTATLTIQMGHLMAHESLPHAAPLPQAACSLNYPRWAGDVYGVATPNTQVEYLVLKSITL